MPQNVAVYLQTIKCIKMPREPQTRHEGERGAWVSTPLEHWGVAGRAPKTRESTRRRRRGEWGLCPFPENLWIKNCTLGALQMKMTANCGIQKFRCREKIKHLSKYWGVVNTGRPLQVKYWGVATPATPAALTPMERGSFPQAQQPRRCKK